MKVITRVVGVRISKEGVGKDQSSTLYSYETANQSEGKRFYSAFQVFEEGVVGEEVEIEFDERPNPKSDKYPYRTIRALKKAPVEGSRERPITPETLGAPTWGTNLLKQHTPSKEEGDVMNLIRSRVKPEFVTEDAFVVTMMENAGCSKERAKELFTVYKNEVR